MVTHISCCFFSRGLLGRNNYRRSSISDSGPSLPRSWHIIREWTVQHFLSEVEELVASFVLMVNKSFYSEQICGSIECCINFLSSRRPSCHTIWASPFATRRASSGAPAQQTSGPSLHGRVRGPASVAKVRSVNDHGPEDQVSSGNSKYHRQQFGARYARQRISFRMALCPQPGRSWSGRLPERRGCSCSRRQAQCFGCRRPHEVNVLLDQSGRGRVRVNSPSTPSSGSTAGGGVHVVWRSGPQGKAEAEARAARCPGERPKRMGTSFLWVESKATLHCCCARVVLHTTSLSTSVVAPKSKRREKASGCQGIHARLPHRGNSLAVIHERQRPPISFCNGPCCFSSGRGLCRGVTGDLVHVITVPSPGPPAVAALAHILDGADPSSNFDEDSFEDVGGQWHYTSWF